MLLQEVGKKKIRKCRYVNTKKEYEKDPERRKRSLKLYRPFSIYKEGKGPEYIYSIQPSILKLKDGRLQVLMRTHNAKLATSFSSDNGDTWSKVTSTDIPNNQS